MRGLIFLLAFYHSLYEYVKNLHGVWKFVLLKLIIGIFAVIQYLFNL
jgi:hypothetical protein